LVAETAKMTDQLQTIRRPWRRHLRFSVRGLIVLVLVTGGWLGWVARGARIQREAVSAARLMMAFGTIEAVLAGGALFFSLS
jgi:hypothetical protein